MPTMGHFDYFHPGNLCIFNNLLRMIIEENLKKQFEMEFGQQFHVEIYTYSVMFMYLCNSIQGKLGVFSQRKLNFCKKKSMPSSTF